MKSALGLCVCLLLCLAAPAAAEDPQHRRLAEHYAPVVFQETRSAVLDFITRFDYDGDWSGDNNWRNAYLFEMPGYAYYSVIESTGHYFITYAFYHARDYTARPYEGFAPKTEHENDMEGCTLTIEKDGTPFGSLVMVETLAHDVFYKYDNPARRRVSNGRMRLDGSIELVDGRLAVYIEPEGHGVKAAGRDVVQAGAAFPGVVYRFTGQASVPISSRDPNATYDLLSLEDSLWPRRFDIGSTFCCADSYLMNGGASISLGSAFNGPVGSCAAKPPWGWDQADDPLAKGDWFRDPLRSYAAQLRVEGLTGTYLHNPFLLNEGRSVGPLCSQSATSKTVRGALTSSLIGIARALTAGGFSRAQIGSQARQLFLTDAVLLEWSRRGELERWSWDTTLAVLPALVSDGLRDELHIPLAERFALDSPEFKAPARYFDSLVMRYRTPRSDLRARVSWTYEGTSEFADVQSLVAPLAQAETPLNVRFDLAGSPSWDPARRIQRIRVTIESPTGPVAPGGPAPDAGQFVLSHVVLDRNAFSDTFER